MIFGGPRVALISLTLVSVTPGFDVKPLRGIKRATSKIVSEAFMRSSLTLRVTIRYAENRY
jgi:hypothetical protein